MQKYPTRMTAAELSAVFDIAEDTVKRLAKTNQLPCKRQNNRLLFDFNEIIEYFKRLEGDDR